MSDTQLEKREQKKLAWRDLDMANPADIAGVMFNSRMFKGVNDMTSAMVKVVAGRELGIGAFAAMTNIDIVKGQARLRSNLLATMVKQHPKYDYRVREWDAEQCRIEFFEVGPCVANVGDDGKTTLRTPARETIGYGEWTIVEAKLAGIHQKDGAWGKYPKAMLFARAMSNGVRAHCPDVTAGIAAYTEGDDFGPMRSVPQERASELDTALEEPETIDAEVVETNKPEVSEEAAEWFGEDKTAPEGVVS